jgi:hypothetical protein
MRTPLTGRSVGAAVSRISLAALTVVLVRIFLHSATICSATPFGVNAHTPGSAVISEAIELGVEWVRIDFVWAFIERQPHVADWSEYDLLIDQLHGRGLRILASIGYTPAWATQGPELTGVPTDPDEWQDFCYRAAERYRGRIDAWGLWNEPNLSRFWGGTRSEYIYLILLPGANAIHAADPMALVTGPDLAHLSSAHWDEWLASVLSVASNHLDIVTHHIYPGDGWSGQVTDALEEDAQWPWDPPSVREVLQDKGWWGRPFWLTETGVQSQEYGEVLQALFFTNLLTEWYRPSRTRPWVDRIFFYEMNDYAVLPERSWGILGPEPEYRRKLAFNSYHSFIPDAVHYDAEVVEISAPAFISPEEVAELRVVLRNSGTVAWRSDEVYTFTGSCTDPDWELPLIQLRLDHDLPPGAATVITVPLAAPAVPSASLPRVGHFRWRMHRQGSWFFGETARHTTTAGLDPPPLITRNPGSWIAPEGSTIELRVAAESPRSPGFQWRRNSVELADDEHVAGAWSATLTITGVSPEHAGTYDCVVSNRTGATVSEPATVTVTTGVPGDVPPRRPSARARPVLPD